MIVEKQKANTKKTSLKRIECNIIINDRNEN